MLQNPRRRELIPKWMIVKTTERDLLKSFTEYLAGECYLAESTVKAYHRDIKHFWEFFRSLGNRTISSLTVSDLTDYVGWLHKRNLAPVTMSRHVITLRLFYRFLQLEGIVKDNPAEMLGNPKLWFRIPRVLSPKEVDRLLDSPMPGEPFWRRDRALLEMLYATGCRASELENLTVQDIYLDEKYCLCKGKGKKQRFVPLGNRAIEAFQYWNEIERTRLVARYGETKVAFLSCRGKKMSQQRIWDLVSKYSERAGLTTGISPHTMRHCFATHMMAAGADLRKVQEMLGHASIASTQIYTHVDMTRLKEIHAKYHPRG